VTQRAVPPPFRGTAHSGSAAVLTLSYHGTHYYLLDVTGGKLLVDAGWPGSLPTLASKLKAYRIDGHAIRYVLPTHYHPDHAGLVQEVKQAWGARLIIHEAQLPYVPQLATLYAKKGGYVPIRVEASDLVLGQDNRVQLLAMGLQGEVILTPGHSDDSVSLVIDDGKAFVGDLPPPFMAGDANALAVRTSWETLRSLGARTIYHAHSGAFTIEQVSQYLDGNA
jgi:glyoxylase-like metal-dependent hydrolase (beta-lactamase superfamily II)